MHQQEIVISRNKSIGAMFKSEGNEIISYG